MKKITNLESLFNLEDSKAVQNELKNGYIHIFEMIDYLLKNKEFKTLFDLCFEWEKRGVNTDDLKHVVIKKYEDGIKKEAFKKFKPNKRKKNMDQDSLDINCHYLFGHTYFADCKTFDDSLKEIEDARQDFMQNWALKRSKKLRSQKHNMAYFNNLLKRAESDPELCDNFKIKLSQKLEDVLKNDYNCKDETLVAKINHFFDEHLEFGKDIQNKFHRLRQENNNMKHSEQENVEELSLADLKDCLDFVCFIDKDEPEEIKDIESFFANEDDDRDCEYDDYDDDDDYYDWDDD